MELSGLPLNSIAVNMAIKGWLTVSGLSVLAAVSLIVASPRYVQDLTNMAGLLRGYKEKVIIQKLR